MLFNNFMLPRNFFHLSLLSFIMLISFSLKIKKTKTLKSLFRLVNTEQYELHEICPRISLEA